MDKNTLSNYGWIVIAVLVLSVMIALATPFGSYIEQGVRATTEGLFDTSKNAVNTAFKDLGVQMDDQEFEEGYAGVGESSEPEAIEGSVTFGDGTTLTWEELKLAENGAKYNYNASAITDTEIGANAFEESLISSINIPNGVVSIGNYAFYHCFDLESVTLPNGLITIGNGAFSEMGLQSIIIPDTVTTIGSYAFWDNYVLSFYIPASVTSIGNCAFFHFKEIDVDPANPNYCSVNNVLYSKDMKTLIKAPYEYETDTVIIPDTVTKVEYLALCGLGVTEIVLPNNLIVDGSTFYEAYSLEKITVSNDNPNYSSVDGILYSKDMKTLVKYPYNKSGDTYVLPETIETIGTLAFYQGCIPLNFIIPETNHEVIVEEYAFEESPFVSITYPEDIPAEAIFALQGSMMLQTINYGGTIEQWNALSEHEDWESTWNTMLEYMPITDVICSDGTAFHRDIEF